MAENGEKSKLGVVLGVVAILVILVIIGAVFYQNMSDQKKTDDMISNLETQITDLINKKEMDEEVVDELEDKVEDVKEELTKELEEELDYTIRRITVLKVELPESFSDDLELIEDYIKENPEVLEDDTISIPADVQAAVIRVREAIEEGYASSMTPETEEEVSVQIGDQYTVLGTLEEADFEENTLGTVYMLTDDELGVTLYFQFSESVSEEMDEEMLNEEVEVTVEITEVRKDGVTYMVVDGPTLAE